MSRSYPRLGVVEFGRKLVGSGDLDPVYLALPDSTGGDMQQIARFLVSYWCFYNVGQACYMSDHQGREFWGLMDKAARNEEPTPFGERWPRAKERRHFRGAAAVGAVEKLRHRYENPEEMLDFLTTGLNDIKSVVDRANTHHLFGPWVNFKVADMLDAVWGYEVVQNDLNVFMYDTPRKSILHHWREFNGFPEHVSPRNELYVMDESMKWLAGELHDLTIPHKPGMKLDMFALETIWCKHHSHLSGHYPLDNDLHEISEGLQPWLTHSTSARDFLASLPTAMATST